MPMEATMMVAIPELDGATGPIGLRRALREAQVRTQATMNAMRAHPERATPSPRASSD
jgi:hypothetical protein